ncbi:DinB family protein [Tenacibaculum jejuense]|uniref:DinB-like domain-containing protein n=1 Tax=Tenacibaculum jejuense TaxID=584609 RepID=A0A238U8L1_9FLAO|nr:hypothetical protein [Tenacibaculum jejuense]SNR15529.1 conserved exported protein of unknown function [Tenacibaculum jejuense]
MKKVFPILILLVMSIQIQAQDLPYYEIPKASDSYTAGSVASRLIDGLGFRYYWATEGLTEKDLAFKPTPESRTSGETIDHILGLSQVVLNAALKKPNGEKQPEMSFKEKREKTLQNLKKASDILKNETDLTEFKVIFGENKFPFWNAINGPIADAMWHVGQVVTFRRSSGNPFPKGVSVFTGKVRK